MRTSSGRRIGEVQRNRAADAEAEQVDLGQVEVLQQADHVGGQVRRGQRPVEIVGAAVSLEVGGDDLSAGGQTRQQRAELQVDVEQPAVQQQQRRTAGPVDLVVHLQPVDGGVPGPDGVVGSVTPTIVPSGRPWAGWGGNSRTRTCDSLRERHDWRPVRSCAERELAPRTCT